MKVVALLVLALIALVSATPSCTPNGACLDCTESGLKECGGTFFDSALEVNCVDYSSVPTDGPCADLEGQKGCVVGSGISSINVSFLTTTYQNDFLTACRALSGHNSDCCVFECPSTCDGVTTGNEVSGSVADFANNQSWCYPYCTDCAGAGQTDSWCTSNCGNRSLGGVAPYACADDSNCCEFSGGSASTLGSFLLSFFYCIGF